MEIYQYKGNNIYFEVVNNEAVIVRGNCDQTGALWIPSEVEDSLGNVYPVTKIQGNEGGNWSITGAFSGNTNITEVHIPGSVKSIGIRTFNGCRSLSLIDIAEGVEYISQDAFWQAAGKANLNVTINIPSTVKRFRSYTDADDPAWGRAFSQNNGNGGISDLPEGTVLNTQLNFAPTINTNVINANTFDGCGDLKSFTIPEGIETIETGAFHYTKFVGDVTFPSTLKTINNMFAPGGDGVGTYSVDGDMIMKGDAPSVTTTDIQQLQDHLRGKILVPEQYYNNYASDPQWSKIINKIEKVKMAETKTNIGLQFFKGWYGKGTATTLPSAEGAIVFNEEEHIIYVNGQPYGGATDVSFENNVLTITYSDGRDPITLDFNDTASANATLAVFKHLNDIVGDDFDAVDKDSKLNYNGTNYLAEQGTQGTQGYQAAAASLVEADKRLDTAIKTVDTRIDNMNVAENTVDGTNVHVTYKEVQGIVTVQGVAEDYATLTGTRYVKEDEEKGVQGVAPALTITEGDEGKLLKASDTTTVKNYVDDKIEELKDQMDAGDDVDGYEQAEYDGTGDITIAGIKEEDGKIARDEDSDITITVNHEYSKTDAEGEDTSTDLATVETVRGAIDSLDVTSNTVDGTNVHVTYKEEDGIVTVESVTEDYTTVTRVAKAGEHGAEGHVEPSLTVTDGTKIAKGSDIEAVKNYADDKIEDSIEQLDADNIQTITVTAAGTGEGSDYTDGITLNFKGVTETDGVIAQGTRTETQQFAKVATTGESADVHYDSTGNQVIKGVTDVNAALKAIDAELKAQTGGMRYNGGIASATATKNTVTGDVRPGDIYLATGSFTIGTTSVEAGDMIVYKGDESTEDVALTADNCNIIERETDLMVTAGDTLTNDYIMVGNGNKEVRIDTTEGKDPITVTSVHTAQERAASALQTITAEENTLNEGNYVNVAITEKTGEDGAKTQAISSTVKTTTLADAKAAEGETAGVDGLATALDVKTNLNNAIDALDADFTNTTGEEGGSDKRAKDAKANVAVSLKEEDGVVTTLGVDVSYAGITYTPGTKQSEATAEKPQADSTLVVAAADADKLVIGSDITNLVSFTNGRLAEEIDKLDATVASETIAEGGSQTSTVLTTIVEENGKLTSVTNNVLGADVTYTAATETADATLAATNATGAVLGSDVANIKSYIDAKAAANKVGVTNYTVDAEGKVTTTENDDAIVIDKTENTVTGKTDYNVRLVWSEWSGNPNA